MKELEEKAKAVANLDFSAMSVMDPFAGIPSEGTASTEENFNLDFGDLGNFSAITASAASLTSPITPETPGEGEALRAVRLLR